MRVRGFPMGKHFELRCLWPGAWKQVISDIRQIVPVGSLQFLERELPAVITSIAATIFQPEILPCKGSKLFPVCYLQIPIVMTTWVDVKPGKESIYVVKGRIEERRSRPIAVNIFIDALIEGLVMLPL